MFKIFPYRYRVLLLLFFLILVTYLDRVCISIVGTRIKAGLHLSNGQFGWILGAFALAYALFEIPAGILGDRIGQRKVFIRIVLWWSLFTVLTGLVNGFMILVVVRFLFGMGEAGAIPNGSATVARWFPVSETARGMSWLIIGSSAGAAIAPLIIVPLASAWGWRIPFFVCGAIGIVWVLVCYGWFKNEPAEMKNISTEEKERIEKNRRFTDQKHSFPWKPAFKNKSLLALVSSYFCSQWALYFFIAWMPVYLQEGRHFSETEMKNTTSYLFLIGIIGGLCTGFTSDWLVRKRGLKSGRRIIGATALLIMAILFTATALASSATVTAGCLMSCYFFMPANGIVSFSACIDIGRNRAGTVAGIMNFFGNTGSFFLAILFGKIVDVTHSFNAPLFFITGVLLVGSLLWLAVDPSKELETETIQVN